MLEHLRSELAAAVAAALDVMGVEKAAVVLEIPPRRQLGDLAWAGALPLARTLRRPPRAIAEEVVQLVTKALSEAPEASPLRLLESEASVEGPGFVNFRLRRGPSLARILGEAPTAAAAAQRLKVIVEHTNINPNKAAHIGHLRNSVLGDTLVRCLRSLGHDVEVQDYIDDTGVQVADVVVGFLFLPEDELLEVAGAVWPEAADGAGTPRSLVLSTLLHRAASDTLVSERLGDLDFDDLCWDLYPRVTRRYDGDPEFGRHRAAVLHAIEEGFPESLSLDEALVHLADDGGDPAAYRAGVARLAAAVAEGNLRCHLVTMGRLGVAYDLLPHESNILQRGFWQRAFELLLAAGSIRLETEGKNAGCWVMPLSESPEFAGMSEADKILVRSNGTVTYTAKDIAYQLWKLGLLRDPDGALHDFGYRPFARYSQEGPAVPVAYGDTGAILYRSTDDEDERPEGTSFGAGNRIYNVIDVRQSYPQKVVREAVRILGYPEAADSSIHFAYEMVALTPAAVRRLEAAQGLNLGLSEEDMSKPFVEMSGRRGIGVKADTLLATLVEEAKRAIADRRGEGEPLPREEVGRRARAIAVGALRYQMARQGRNRVLAFDFDEALAFEGDTGPYLQYSAVRAKKIFDKLATQGLAASAPEDADLVASAEVGDDLWELAFACARTNEVVAKAVESLEFSLLAGHARDLAQTFHKLYHEHPVLHAPDDTTRALRRAVFRIFSATIATILERHLGIPIPDEM